MLFQCGFQVAAGLGHCLGVTSKGDVVAWGWNAAGQLGLGPSLKEQVVYSPTQVSIPACIFKYRCRSVLKICAFALYKHCQKEQGVYTPAQVSHAFFFLARKIQHFTVEAPLNQHYLPAMQTFQPCLCALLCFQLQHAMSACWRNITNLLRWTVMATINENPVCRLCLQRS